ncbi:MAG: hypothetical protein NVSMB23_00870 [Myxococcales bacterium]
MRRRVFVVSGEYSANPRHLPPERRSRAWLSALHDDPPQAEFEKLFFRYPNRSEDGRARPEDWERDFNLERPVGLIDLFASAGHRALSSLHRQLGGTAGDFQETRDAVTDLFVTSMPGLDPNERTNIGLVPQMLKGMLGLAPRTRAQFVVGTSDSGAWAFAQAVRTARLAERPATILVLAGQVIPSGYASQYQIRTVLGEDDQARGLDMLAVGDLVMDIERRSLGLSTDAIEEHLAHVSARKFQLSNAYPAGFSSGKPAKRTARRTPYFDGADIASPCCGAAVTILTSDEELIARVASARTPRYRRLPLVEVLGVGEGSSNANFLQRESPLLFATAVREALAATADDARLPLSAFGQSAFAVLHDAFPSIELSFLLGMGLGWERAKDRARDCWGNPLGGLLAFGHALGASGLVQVNKTLHLFAGDTRYVRRDAPGVGEWRHGFRSDGALAATTSVGGPLSHIVGGLFRGGFEQLPPLRQRFDERRGDDEVLPISADWVQKRRKLRLALPHYLTQLRGDLREGEHRSRHLAAAEPHFLEGVTAVSIRSCLRALDERAISHLAFDGLELLVRPERLEQVRGALRQLVLVLLHEADRLPSLFDVFKVLSDELRELAREWREAGLFLPSTGAVRHEKLADAVKECLRVPLAITFGSGPDGVPRRAVRFLPLDAEGGGTLGAKELQGVDILLERGGAFVPLPPGETPAVLPWWHALARRPDGPTPQAKPGIAPEALVDALLENGSFRGETESGLDLLRGFFDAGTQPLALELLAGKAGAPVVRKDGPVPAFVYLCRIVTTSLPTEGGAAHELLGRAAQQGRAWLEGWDTSAAQVGDLLSVLCFQKRAHPGNGNFALLAAARFAREVATTALQAGVVVRAAISIADGAPFTDVNGTPSVSTPAAQRTLALLAALQDQQIGPDATPKASPCIAFDLSDGAALQQEALRKWLPGWETASPRSSAAGAIIYWKRTP